MSDNRPPYHRRITRPLPKPELPAVPPSAKALEQDGVVTMVCCPWCECLGQVTRGKREEWRATYDEIAGAGDTSIEPLVACPWCGGDRMVTPDQRSAWRAKYPEIADREPTP